MEKSIFFNGTALSAACHVIILIGFLITVVAVVSGSVSLWLVTYRNKKIWPSVMSVLSIILLVLMSLTVTVLSVLEVVSYISFSGWLVPPGTLVAFAMAKTIFDQAPSNAIPRSRFNLTHDKKLSLNQGDLIPIMLKEAYPGDSFQVSHQCMIRLAPLIGPAYTRMKVKVESFFVPWRILWNEEDYEKWITGGADGLQTAVHPYFSQAELIAQWSQSLNGKGTYWDYFGLPLSVDSPQWVPKVSALPFRALAQIFNDWYAIPGITTLVDFSKASGAITDAGEMDLLFNSANRNRAWSRDYFTSAQPTAQRGSAAVAPIDIVYSAQSDFKHTDGTNVGVGRMAGVATDGVAGKLDAAPYAGNPSEPGRIENIASAGLLVEKFRIAAAVQKFLEAMSRGGSRYVEMNWQMFRQRGKDSRLQRAEFIAGYTGPVQISEVLSSVQFEGTSDDLPQASMAGHGIHVGGSKPWRYTADEHGYFITMLSVVPEGGRYGSGNYSGVEKLFQRFDKYDLAWPLFEHLGEQAIHRSELCCNIDDADEDEAETQVFGYTMRYADLKWAMSQVHGDFRDDLDSWTQNRGWAPSGPLEQPVLGNVFTQVNYADDDLDRIFAVQDPDVHKLWCLIVNDVSASRPFSYNPIPGI